MMRSLNRFRILAFITSNLLLFIFMPGSSSPSQEIDNELPLLISAEIPLYPLAARVAGIEGTVELELVTDGERISNIAKKSGPPLLVQAAEENVKTWVFRQHKPIRITTKIMYKRLPGVTCSFENGTVLLRLPEEGEISAKWVRNCDPVVGRKLD